VAYLGVGSGIFGGTGFSIRKYVGWELIGWKNVDIAEWLFF